MFTADQLVAHAVGDYILQSDWMADNKTKDDLAAFIHALWYTVPFGFLTQSLLALFVIFATHYFIDRYRLARYVVWLKNWPIQLFDLRPGNLLPHVDWKPITATGYSESKPPFLSVWLLIIADNILHVFCNAIALRAFG